MVLNGLLSILIVTHNRLPELKKTIEKLLPLLKNSWVELVICDDYSKDGTYEFIKQKYPSVILIRNRRRKGYIYSRNFLLNNTKAKYAISLDDDSHIINIDSIKGVINYFDRKPNCAVLALRIFWGINKPENNLTDEEPHRVKSFVGCGHIWRMSAWKNIPNYPEWFKFYGEEDFASFHLFKRGLEVHYYPDILIHHRVDVKSRKKNKDYIQRTRRALRSGWYLYLMFYPKRLIPKRMAYSIWIQLKNKVFQGDLKALIGMKLALFDLSYHFFCLCRNSSRLDINEFKIYSSLSDTKIYWTLKK